MGSEQERVLQFNLTVSEVNQILDTLAHHGTYIEVYRLIAKLQEQADIQLRMPKLLETNEQESSGSPEIDLNDTLIS